MSKVLDVTNLSISSEEGLCNIFDYVEKKPECKYLFSKQFVSEISKCANYGRSELKSEDGCVQIYEIINENYESMIFAFECNMTRLGNVLFDGKPFEGYVLKEITNKQGQKITVKGKYDETIVIM